MMRPLLLSFFILLNLASFSQKKKVTSSLRVPVTINWAKGETSYLKIIKSDENVETDEYSKIRTESDVRLKVLEKTDTSYTLEWTYTKVDAIIEDYQLRGAIIRLGKEEEIKALILKMLEGSEEASSGMKIVYTTDQYGGFKDITNRDEIKEQYRKTFRNMIGVLTAELPQQKRDSLETFFTFMADIIVADPDFGLTFEDIQLLHTAYGYEYEVGNKLKDVGYMESPFGDNQYEVDVELLLKDYDSSLKKCTLEGTTKLNEETMRLYMEDFKAKLKELGLDSNALVRELEIKSVFNLSIDLHYGWIYDAEMTTTTKNNHDISTSNIKIKLRL